MHLLLDSSHRPMSTLRAKRKIGLLASVRDEVKRMSPAYRPFTGLLDWDNTNIIFTKRSLIEFLKYQSRFFPWLLHCSSTLNIFTGIQARLLIPTLATFPSSPVPL
jgi:hypothetical protein